MNKIVLGQKLRKLREKAAISQLTLEIQIDAASGSLSRIENGKTNPTKETLVKIIEVLQLDARDAASLFDINIDSSLIKSIQLLKNIHSAKELDELFQTIVNEVSYKLNLLSAVIFMVEGDKVFSKRTTETSFHGLSLKLIGAPFNKLNVSLSKDNDNYIVKTVLERRSYVVNDLYHVTKGAIPKALTKALARLSKFKSGITLPMIIDDDKVIGVLFVGKAMVDDFESEKAILEELVEYISLAISKFHNG